MPTTRTILMTTAVAVTAATEAMPAAAAGAAKPWRRRQQRRQQPLLPHATAIATALAAERTTVATFLFEPTMAAGEGTANEFGICKMCWESSFEVPAMISAMIPAKCS